MKDIIRDDENFTTYSGVKTVIEHLGSIENIGICYNKSYVNSS